MILATLSVPIYAERSNIIVGGFFAPNFILLGAHYGVFGSYIPSDHFALSWSLRGATQTNTTTKARTLYRSSDISARWNSSEFFALKGGVGVTKKEVSEKKKQFDSNENLHQNASYESFIAHLAVGTGYVKADKWSQFDILIGMDYVYCDIPIGTISSRDVHGLQSNRNPDIGWGKIFFGLWF